MLFLPGKDGYLSQYSGSLTDEELGHSFLCSFYSFVFLCFDLDEPAQLPNSI